MDVLVVGAGVIGAAVADALARRGASVLVIDMRGPGRGASRASAGILAPYTEALASSKLLELGVRSLALYDEFVARVNEGQPGDPVEYRRTGTLDVALNIDALESLVSMRGTLEEIGVACSWHDGPAARELEPALTPTAIGALLVPTQGFVAVKSLVEGLVRSATRAGAVFSSPVEAALVTSEAGGVTVKTESAVFRGDRAVIAAGSWSRRVRVANVPVLPVRPIRGQLLHLQWCESDEPRRVIWGPDCYVVPWTDGSVLVGATMEDAGFDEGTTVAGVQALTTAVSDLLPHASRARLEDVRVGLRPALPDSLPAIGPFSAAPRVMAATGHYRNGVLLAPLTAELVARALLDGVEDETFEFTTPDRFLS